MMTWWPYLLRGALFTIQYAVSGALMALSLGIAVAFMGQSGVKALVTLVRGYTLLVRGIPLLVFIVFAYYALPLSMSQSMAAVMVLGAYYAAFVGEVLRGSVQSVHGGQWDAGRSLGMGRLQTFALIILPQAFRAALPPLLNLSADVIKSTSLISAVGLWELTQAGRELAEQTNQPLQVLISTAVIYFVLCAATAKLADLANSDRMNRRFTSKGKIASRT